MLLEICDKDHRSFSTYPTILSIDAKQDEFDSLSATLFFIHSNYFTREL